MSYSDAFSHAHNSRARSLGVRRLPLAPERPPRPLGAIVGALAFGLFVAALFAIRSM